MAKLTRAIKDYFTEAEVKELVEKAKLFAFAGKTDVMKLLIEQLFGKAPQPLTGKDGGPIEAKVVMLPARNENGGLVEGK